jgi:hypothetical protein
MQLAIGDADVACSGEQLMPRGSPLLIDTGIMGSQPRKQIALGLMSNHLDDIGQVLAFGGELDEGRVVEVSDFDALGNVAALLEQLRHASACCAQLLAEPAEADLEARMVGRRCSALSAAAAPYSRSSLARSTRAARICLSKARRSGLGMVRVGSSGSIW